MKGKVMRKTTNEIVYEYVKTQLQVSQDFTRRGKKGAMTRIERLGNELVKRELLTQEQADELLHY